MSTITLVSSGFMEFDLVLFLKVGLTVLVHAALLYIIFRQLDKVFGGKR